jgi:ribonuclease P/MRP protein subunit POP8
MGGERETIAIDDAPNGAREQNQPSQVKQGLRSGNMSVLTSKTITTPPFSYICLELVSDTAARIKLDEITVRTYITSALTQFLGLTGSAMSVDILKVQGKESWIRVPREDLSPVVAAMGGWFGKSEAEGSVGWKVKASGNWLGVLVAEREAETLWRI